MNLDFKPEVLSKEYVKENGVLYDDNVFYSENEEWLALLDKTPELGGKPFTGLLYELYMNGIPRYYEYYREGFADGEYVTFYDNGAVASYCIMKGFAYVGDAYEWHRNGKLKRFDKKDGKGIKLKTVCFDTDGNITYLMEKGKVIINKGWC